MVGDRLDAWTAQLPVVDARGTAAECNERIRVMKVERPHLTPTAHRSRLYGSGDLGNDLARLVGGVESTPERVDDDVVAHSHAALAGEAVAAV